MLHLHTQANESLAVVDDRHGLHEPQPGRPRRPGVRPRPDPARRRAQDRRRPRARSRGAAAASARGCSRARRRAGAADAADGPLRRQHAQRRRHRGRQGRGRAPLRRVGQHAMASTTSSRPSTQVDDGAVDDDRDRRASTATTSRPNCAPAASGPTSLRVRRPHRGRPAAVPRRRRLRGVHDQLRGPRRPAPAPGSGRAAADGRRLRLRWRGRLEDGGARAHAEGDVGRGRPGGTSFMEDYTYHFGPGEPKVLGAHMLEVCPSITTRPCRASRSTR